MEPDSLWPGSLRDAAADPFEAPGAACGAGCQRRLHRGPSQRLAGELLGCGVDVAGAHRLSGPFKHARDRLEHRAGTGRGVPWLARSRCRFREEPLVNQGQLGELKLESRVRTCPVIFLKAGAGRAGFGEGALDYSRRRLRKDGRLRVERVAGYADEGHWAPGPAGRGRCGVGPARARSQRRASTRSWPRLLMTPRTPRARPMWLSTGRPR